MDQATKAALKNDPLATSTGNTIDWASRNRQSVIITAAVVLGLIVLAVVGVVVWNQRAKAASEAFGQAMDVYEAPVQQAGQPALPGVKSYASLADRAKDANKLFLNIADQYGMTTDGQNARYFAGLTYIDEGQTQSAENTLKQVADSWDKQRSSLAKLSLAGLYRQTGRDQQAIDLYKELTDHPTDAVPASLAQIQLAELYTAEGKTAQAKEIYAHLKDSDKNAKGKPGVASEIAGEKLNPTPQRGAPAGL